MDGGWHDRRVIQAASIMLTLLGAGVVAVAYGLA
ncbi:hypothetical protein SAMN05444161_4656 [Rhizobiales bacterium GAS191]|nr:hypothetical protein SAMN05444161_4656 [Rhizobiales bacterium GAS191]